MSDLVRRLSRPLSGLNGPRRDARTGLPLDEASTPQTDEDRRVRRLREREQWISAVSEGPPLID